MASESLHQSVTALLGFLSRSDRAEQYKGLALAEFISTLRWHESNVREALEQEKRKRPPMDF